MLKQFTYIFYKIEAGKTPQIFSQREVWLCEEYVNLGFSKNVLNILKISHMDTRFLGDGDVQKAKQHLFVSAQC